MRPSPRLLARISPPRTSFRPATLPQVRTSPSPSPLLAQRQQQRPALYRGSLRTMASGSAPLQEWLVICPDFEGALEKRLAVRGEHLEGIKADPEEFWLFGGAMLEEPIAEGQTPKMKGSAMLVGAKTREEVVERLKRDVYVKGGVWDFEKVTIVPFKSAIRKAA